MHTSTSPQYAIIASCDVAAAMMEPPGGTGAGRGVDHGGARLPPRDAQGRRGVRRLVVVQGLGTRTASRRRASAAATTGCSARTTRGTASASSPPGFNMLDPIKATVLTPGLDVDGDFADHGIPAAIVTKYLAEHGVIVEKTGLYSFFIMFTIGITKGRWNTLLTALQQFKADYDAQPAAVARAAGVRAGASRATRRSACASCATRSTASTGQRHRPPDDRDVRVEPRAGDEAGRRVRAHGAPRDRARRDRRPRGARDERAADALSAGHPAADPRRALQPPDRQVPAVRARLQRALPRLRHRHPRAGRGGDRRAHAAISSTASRARR